MNADLGNGCIVTGADGVRRYRASRELEAFICATAPKHYPSANAPSTYAALIAAWEARGEHGLPVYDGGCDATIYSSAHVNHAFRAWHDSVHATYGYEFNAYGERHVARTQCQRAQNAGLARGDVAALHFDVWWQFVYAEFHGGEFPADQAAFVAACFVDGPEAASLGNY